MPSVSFGNTLTTRALRREGLQLGLVAVLAALPLLFGSRALQVIAGIAAAAMCAVAAVALVVAWRVSGRAGALVLYAVAAVIFAVIAVLNLRA